MNNPNERWWKETVCLTETEGRHLHLITHDIKIPRSVFIRESLINTMDAIEQLRDVAAAIPYNVWKELA